MKQGRFKPVEAEEGEEEEAGSILKKRLQHSGAGYQKRFAIPALLSSAVVFCPC